MQDFAFVWSTHVCTQIHSCISNKYIASQLKAAFIQVCYVASYIAMQLCTYVLTVHAFCIFKLLCFKLHIHTVHMYLYMVIFLGKSGDGSTSILIVVFFIVLIIFYCCLVFLFFYCYKRKGRHYPDRGKRYTYVHYVYIMCTSTVYPCYQP